MRKIFCFLIISLFCVNLYAEKYFLPDSITQTYCRFTVDEAIKDIEVNYLFKDDSVFCKNLYLASNENNGFSIMHNKLVDIDIIINRLNILKVMATSTNSDEYKKYNENYYYYINELQKTKEKLLNIADSKIKKIKGKVYHLGYRLKIHHKYNLDNDKYRISIVVSKSQLQKLISDNIISKEDAANLKPRVIERNYDDNITILRTPCYHGGSVITHTSWY